MHDEERLKKLTELARRVWPSLDGTISIEEFGCEGHVIVRRNAILSEVLLIATEHPRALDALEAALSVLAGLQPFARFIEANTRLGSAVADYRTVLVNIRELIRVQYLDERPFDDNKHELGTLRHLVTVLWKALESVEDKP